MFPCVISGFVSFCSVHVTALLNERLRAVLHLVFTREVLEEIPTALQAITNLGVTSYS